MEQVILKDVIKIVDQDILDALSFTLYQLKWKEAVEYNEKAYSDFIEKFCELLTVKIEYAILGFDSHQMQQDYHIRLMFELFNNWRDKYYLTNLFLVTEIHTDYFKVGLLNDNDYRNFEQLGVLNKMLAFLRELRFPHKDQMKSFYRIGCGWK